MNNNILEINNVSKEFRTGNIFSRKKLLAVEGINISIPKNEPRVISIVGESGSGKTTLARMILRLIQPTNGEILVDNIKVSTRLNRKDKVEFYKTVQPIFQNPFESFSYRRTVDNYLIDTALHFTSASTRKEALEHVNQALVDVGITANYINGRFPNQFSGGELQRISVARAMIPDTKLLIADEPVSMIDASLRMNTVNLFKTLRDEYHKSIVYITHDLSTAYYVSDLIAIMYRGNIVEYGISNEILKNPLHPYTELLLSSVAKIGEKWEEMVRMPDIETKEFGYAGCKFAGRCPYVKPICKAERPPNVTRETREVLCFKLADYQSSENRE